MAIRTKQRAARTPASQRLDRPLKQLADLANEYPFRWFPQGKVAEICGFGEDVMAHLAALGAPIVARKCNPHLLQKWLEENFHRIGKVRT